MKNVLIDTDVILDFFFDREPFSENAAQVLSLCEKKIVIGYITPVILSNVYYLLSQKGKQEKVIEKLKALVSFLEILNIDKNAIITALNSEFKDFEDAIQYYTALENNITTLITRDLKDFKKASIKVMSSEEYLNLN